VGGEFSLTLTNSAGVTSSVPTDVYRVDAHWANYDETQQLTVASGTTSSLRLAPLLGAVTFESDPSGATVTRSDGSTLGTTPLTLPELRPGVWKGELRLDDYIPVSLSLSIVASETNSFRTNLVNWQYSQAMESAWTYFAAGDSARALEAISAALKGKPNDPDALALQKEVIALHEKAAALQQQATIAEHLRKAEEMMAAKNYGGVRSEANAVLKLFPENGQALALLKEVSNREQEDQQRQRAREKEQAEVRRQERLALPKKTFDSVLERNSDVLLFETHELHAALPVGQLETAIWRELETLPAFNVMRISGSAPEAFALSASQEVPGGSRRCVIAGAQTSDKETQVFFKVMEYKKKTSMSFQGQLTFNTSYVPLDPNKLSELSEREKTQVKEGAAMVEERIRRAVGEKKP
jgi:tetratricopeptide (TPR) repeat protein